MQFPRILCAQWWWWVLPVLLRDPQRGNPGSQHPIPVSCQQSFSRRAADCGGWVQFWYLGGHHQGWVSWGMACLDTALNIQMYLIKSYLAVAHSHWLTKSLIFPLFQWKKSFMVENIINYLNLVVSYYVDNYMTLIFMCSKRWKKLSERKTSWSKTWLSCSKRKSSWKLRRTAFRRSVSKRKKPAPSLGKKSK